MDSHSKAAVIAGAIISVIGIVGIFVHISHDDGALAIAGAVIFAAGMISSALTRSKSVD